MGFNIGCMRLVLLLLVCGLSACTPVDTPTGIPTSATPHWSLKGGFHWTWTQKLESGCAYWMAKESWVAVEILVNAKCERKSNQTAGRGISYFSVEDHLTFNGYWPWSQDDYFNLIEFDGDGMIINVRPCPHSLSAQQINEMKVVAHQALAAAQTDGERRVLARIKRRLAALDGRSLASSQSGCTDYNARVENVDVWTRE